MVYDEGEVEMVEKEIKTPLLHGCIKCGEEIYTNSYYIEIDVFICGICGVLFSNTLYRETYKIPEGSNILRGGEGVPDKD